MMLGRILRKASTVYKLERQFGRLGNIKKSFKQKQEQKEEENTKTQNNIENNQYDDFIDDDYTPIIKSQNKKKFISKFSSQIEEYSESESELDLQAEVERDNVYVINQEEKKELEEQDGDKEMSKQTVEFIQQSLLYSGEDAIPEQVVNRPQKGVLWGLGGELLKKKETYFRRDRAPTLDEIVYFLELEQAKDITVTDMHELNRFDVPQYAEVRIVCTTYNCRHNTRISKALQKQINSLQLSKSILKNKVTISGRKDDEWVMVTIGEIEVHLFNEEFRQDFDIEAKWHGRDESIEMAEQHQKYTTKKRHKSRFDPFQKIL